MIVGEFGAARAEVKRQGEPEQIKFYGEVFTIADEVGTMPLLEFAAAAEEGTDAAEMKGLAAMHRLLRDCFVQGDWDRFRSVATANKADADTLLEVCTRVYEVISGRPTESPSDSVGGRPTTSPSSSQRSSRHAELGLVPVDASVLAG